MKKDKCEQIADLNYYNHEQSNRVYGENGLSPTIRTGFDDAKGIKVATSEYTDLEKQLFVRGGHIRRYLNSDIIDTFKEGQMATTNYPNGYGSNSHAFLQVPAS